MKTNLGLCVRKLHHVHGKCNITIFMINILLHVRVNIKVSYHNLQ